MLLEDDYVIIYLVKILEGLLIYFIVEGNGQYTRELQGNIQMKGFSSQLQAVKKYI
jgi:hypothetical protein